MHEDCEGYNLSTIIPTIVTLWHHHHFFWLFLFDFFSNLMLKHHNVMPLTMVLIQKAPSINIDHKRRDIIVSIKKIVKTIHLTLSAFEINYAY